MSYFFHNRLLLLLFDNLHTAPPRISIKLTTIATTVCSQFSRPNTVR